jgi:hypothetical protein
VGVGIPGMIARMHQFGGTLQVHSGPNGTTVHATVPVDRHTRRGRANGHPVGDPLGASAGHQGNASQCVRVGAD